MYEVYIPREMHFFFNAIFLAYVYVFLTKLKKSTTRSCQCKCQSSFAQKLIIIFKILQVNPVRLLVTLPQLAQTATYNALALCLSGKTDLIQV